MTVSQMNQKFHNLTQYLHWYKRLHPGKNTAYLLSFPTHENVGDAAIVLGVHQFLQENGYKHIVEITTAEYWDYRKCIMTLMPRNALICSNGGGSMGDIYTLEEMNRRTVLRDFPKHRIVIFPQTMHYKSETEKQASVPFYNHEHITITARERTSFEMMKETYPRANVILAPDIVLNMDFSDQERMRHGIVACFRGDSEKKLSDVEREELIQTLEQRGYRVSRTDMMHGQQILPEQRKRVVMDKMEELASAELVITDRLHAMILCAISGTPCFVFGNNHHKVRGVYEWIKYLPYIRYAESVTDVEKYLPELLVMQDCRYDNTPLMPYFDKIAEVMKSYAANQCNCSHI